MARQKIIRKLQSYTVDQNQAVPSNSGTLTGTVIELFGRLFNITKAIKGTTNAYDAVPISLQGLKDRQLNTTTPLTGGGDLSANRTLAIDAATTSARGTMSSGDKTKLDGIETGATADQTATEIRAALLTVDGAGSGLDADLLDGLDSSAFASYGGLDTKNSVRAASTGNLTLSGTQTVDGVALVAGDRVLPKNQTTASQNGIYVVATGAWSRAADADTSARVTSGLEVRVEEGTINAGLKYYLSTASPITLDTTALSFSLSAGSGGGGGGSFAVERNNSTVLASATTLDFSSIFSVVADGASEADISLTYGTTAGTVAEGNDGRLSAIYKFSRSGSITGPITGGVWESVFRPRTLTRFRVLFDVAVTTSTTVVLMRRTSGGTVTQIATVTLTTGNFQGTQTGLSVALVDGDSLRVDVTTTGATGGSGLSAFAEAL